MAKGFKRYFNVVDTVKLQELYAKLATATANKATQETKLAELVAQFPHPNSTQQRMIDDRKRLITTMANGIADIEEQIQVEKDAQYEAEADAAEITSDVAAEYATDNDSDNGGGGNTKSGDDDDEDESPKFLFMPQVAGIITLSLLAIGTIIFTAFMIKKAKNKRKGK